MNGQKQIDAKKTETPETPETRNGSCEKEVPEEQHE
eukprot:COSAG05_NODE_1986_length_3740_cov_1527.682505_4_plen_36_part_00